MTSPFSRASAIALLLGAALLSGCDDQPNRASLLETKAIAEEGLIYGLPIVINTAVTAGAIGDPKASTYRGPFNHLINVQKVLTWEDRTIVTPNSDTPYSTAWLDLRAEPGILTVPPVPEGRYFSVQLIDASTNNFAIFGSRTTGNGGGRFMVVGPQWQGDMPAGVDKVFRSGSQYCFALFRTQLFNPADMPNVAKVQDGYKVETLSDFLQQPKTAAAEMINFPQGEREEVKKRFFEYLDFSLAYIPATAQEKDIRGKLARIGVGPDKQFEFKDLPWLHKLAVLWGMKNGRDRLDAAINSNNDLINGWSIGALTGGSAEQYNGNWLARAVVATVGLYALDAQEATYPLTRALADGTPLNTGKHDYTLTFKAGELPPVNAFWSVTMYDAESQFLVKNPINRYLINSPMLPELKKNTDGSITLYIQKDSPGAEHESNWLPGPDGKIYMVLRLYWPKIEAPSILPAGKGSWQPPAIQLVQ